LSKEIKRLDRGLEEANSTILERDMQIIELRDEPRLTGDKACKLISHILAVVLDGTGVDYRTKEGFVKWGVVERDIHKAVSSEIERLDKGWEEANSALLDKSIELVGVKDELARANIQVSVLSKLLKEVMDQPGAIQTCTRYWSIRAVLEGGWNEPEEHHPPAENAGCGEDQQQS